MSAKDVCASSNFSTFHYIIRTYNLAILPRFTTTTTTIIIIIIIIIISKITKPR
jgi:uncharacterized membrane protein